MGFREAGKNRRPRNPESRRFFLFQFPVILVSCLFPLHFLGILFSLVLLVLKEPLGKVPFLKILTP